MSNSLRNLSKRYGTNLDQLPAHMQKMMQQLSQRAQIPAMRADFPELPREKRFKSPEEWKVQVGDQVLLTRGKFKGHVTKVLALHNPTNRLFLELSETKKIVVPKEYWQAGQNSHVIDYPMTTDPKDVKVVGTLSKVDADGIEQEETIAADDVVFKGAYYDEDYARMMPYRLVKNMENVIIPWPRQEPKKDDPWCTSEELAEERTYIPSCLVRTDAPTEIVKSLRDPLAKRPYKWGNHRLNASEAKRLGGLQMPYSEKKKAMFEERRQIRESLATEPSDEVIKLVGERVAAKLNSVEDANFAAWVNKNSAEARQKKAKAKADKKKLADEKLKERQLMKKVKEVTAKKYRGY